VNRPAANPWLHRFAVVTALATLGLIGLGGLVTSKEAGMAVPDWPTSYGYNMFFFPVSQWTGGIFYEHTHRLWASLVGLLTAMLAGWIWARETGGWPRRLGLAAIIATLGLMGVRTQTMFVALALLALGVIGFSFTRLKNDARPVRWWAAIAFSAVLIQGVLGGLRVTALKDQIGIFHGTLAQLFFCLICSLALVTSGRWQNALAVPVILNVNPALRRLLTGLTAAILFQLMLGATMRHQHAGLAIPDFPLAYGKIWPPLDAAFVDSINRQRLDSLGYNAITAFQISLQLAHRLMALVIVLLVSRAAWQTQRQARGTWLARAGKIWLGLILLQATLGAATIWSNKAADIATAHVVLGAASLAFGVLVNIVIFKFSVEPGKSLVHAAPDARVTPRSPSKSALTTI